MKTQSSISVRPATLDDLDRIMVLENECFLTPWGRGTLDYQVINSMAVFLVAEMEARILGFILAWAVEGEVHLLKIAVEEIERRRGVGDALLKELLAEAKNRGGKIIFLEVRRQNVTAIRFYKKYGFLPIGMRKRYYSDTGEDAIVMSKGID